jgi:hypothetical protein
MANSYFETRLESITALPDRRKFLTALYWFAFTGFVATFLSACRGDPVAPTPSTLSSSPTHTPTPTSVCPTASRCNDRHYCDSDQKCTCTQSAEGELRCASLPSTCYTPLCEKSTDCNYLGAGYFCDTPNSGCCTDPPADKARCIPPCTNPPLADVECGTCVACKNITAGDIPSDGRPIPMSAVDCTSVCDAQPECSTVNRSDEFRRLAASLMLQGFRPAGGAESYSLAQHNMTIRRVFAVAYQSREPSHSATLIRVQEASGKAVVYALVVENGKVSFGLSVGTSGYIEKTYPDLANFQASNPFTPITFRGSERELGIIPVVDTQSCSIMCNALCNLLLTGAACSIAGAFTCAFTGPGAILCAVVVGATCSVVGGAGCFVTCDQAICKPKPPARDIWCGCNDKCYSSATDCLAECKASLGCFTGICQQNPEKCKAGTTS